MLESLSTYSSSRKRWDPGLAVREVVTDSVYLLHLRRYWTISAYCVWGFMLDTRNTDKILTIVELVLQIFVFTPGTLYCLCFPMSGGSAQRSWIGMKSRLDTSHGFRSRKMLLNAGLWHLFPFPQTGFPCSWRVDRLWSAQWHSISSRNITFSSNIPTCPVCRLARNKSIPTFP